VVALTRSNYDGKVEVIVVVDGSTDGTADALREMQAPFPLRVIEQPNRGAAAARNRGAAEARHDTLLFLDDDMLCAPDMLGEHARLYLDGADAVVGDARRDPGSPPGFMSDSNEAWLRRRGGPLTLFDIWTGQLSVRRAVFEEIGGFDESYTAPSAFANEDADLGIRLLGRYDVRHNPAAISYQRYVVSPRELIRRAPLRAVGDVRLANKHPEVARSLFEARGVSRLSTRYVFGPLSAIPILPWLWAAIAIPLAEVGLKTWLRSNRTLSRFFLGARATLYWAALRRLGWYPLSDRLLVLGYHAVQDWTDDPTLGRYAVPREMFLEHLEFLARRGFTFVTPDVAAAYITGRAPLPRRAVLLTFDDCYADLASVARDILHPRGIPALAFAVTSVEAATNEWDRPHGGPPRGLLEPEELKQLASLGVEVGSHSRTHRSLVGLGEKERREETWGSANDIEALGLPRPRFFAHPYGEVDEEARTAVRDAGFIGAFGIGEAWIGGGSNAFELPRIIVHASDRGWRFHLRTSAPAVFQRLDLAQARWRTKFKGTLAILSGKRRSA
jgi:glycosyltransferase involved in cell wall biosynthesis/peptidoglycan/xylan/chitin deacetylase (PgdA/CDA1 family)